MEYDIFLRTFLKIIGKYGPMKKKYLRANHATFMTKKVRKAIMIRSKLRNEFLKHKNDNRMITENNAINLLHLFTGQKNNTFLVGLLIIKNFGKQSNHSFQTRFAIKI